MRSLDDWLQHQARLHPQTIDLSLDRLRQLLARLDWHQTTVPVITVAGTNGKGSVAAYCAAILGAAGHRVGLFTSPHLRDYRERIRIGDRWVTETELVAAFERIEAARLAAPVLSLTFFEYNAVAAFLTFEAVQADAWVLEVGLGGRLDAVNVVDASVAVVVSIGLDHQDYLGSTLEAIAAEKAGILRAGRPAVLGSNALPAVLEQRARAIAAPLKRLGSEFTALRTPSGWHYRGPRWDLPSLPAPALQGEAQYGNAATALAALEEVDARLPIPAAAVARGLRAVHLPGRFQHVAPAGPGGAHWILDVAHNPDAARVLAQNLRALPIEGRTFAVCGILADKDASAIAHELRDCFAGWWLASTDGPRGMGAALLCERIRAHLVVPIVLAPDVGAACAGAASTASAADRIVVFGSFHTVGPALEWLETQHGASWTVG